MTKVDILFKASDNLLNELHFGKTITDRKTRKEKSVKKDKWILSAHLLPLKQAYMKAKEDFMEEDDYLFGVML